MASVVPYWIRIRSPAYRPCSIATCAAIVFNLRGLPTRREPLLWELGQRIRDVQQGPDGLLYVLTDEDDGALLRLEPVS